MNPLRIKATNYRTFERLDLDLPEGVVAIVGANGAGKSSAANVPDLALFGPEGRSWAPYLTQGTESTELSLELVFEHAGDTYRVRRGYSARGGGKTTLDLERWQGEPIHSGDDEGPRWEPLTRENQVETQRFLEELLGMTRETFRASSMLVQGDGASFTEATRSVRATLLAKMLGLDRYETRLKAVRLDRRKREDRLERIAGIVEEADRELLAEDGSDRIPVGEAALASTGAALASLGDEEARAETELQAAAVALQAGEDLARRRAEAVAEVSARAAELLPLETRARAADEAEEALAVLQDELDALATTSQAATFETNRAALQTTIDDFRRHVLTIQEATRAAEAGTRERQALYDEAETHARAAVDLQEQIDRVRRGGDDATCPTCQQKLASAGRIAATSALATRLENHATQRDALRARGDAVTIPSIPPMPERPDEAETELRRLDGMIAQAREESLQRARLEGRAQTLREAVAARPDTVSLKRARQARQDAQEALDAVEAPSDQDINVVRASALAARGRLDELRGKRSELEQARAKIEAALERLRLTRDRVAAIRAERDVLRADIDDLAILEQAYGRDGIPALIIGRVALPAIEREACRILAELGTSYRVELRTEKALAGGGTTDALDVVIVTEDGERPYETFSGGERTRINQAIRIALARLLAHRRGAESRLLVIDEPEYLDQAGTAALATVLRGLTGDFDRIYLISHVPELRDALETCLEVTRGPDGYSQIGGLA